MNALINQRFPKDFDEFTQIHDAFIIIHSLNSPEEYIGLNCLIKGFSENGYPFKIYHCYNPEEFKEVLKRETTKYIWVFGHGWRGGVSFKFKKSFLERLMRRQKKVNFSYESICDEISLYPKKLFIAQFHCNHIKKDLPNTPLISLLMHGEATDTNHFLSVDTLWTCSIWHFTRKLMKDVVRDTPIKSS